MRKLYLNLIAAVGFLAFAGISQAVSYGTYTLDNHPDGNQTPPAYGLRLDGLSGGSSVLTFDVTNRGMGSGLTMAYTASGIHISGSIWGGVDTGSSWSSPQLWTFDFTYSMVTTVTGDDDAWAHNTDTSTNSVIFGLGTITQVSTGTVWDLRDQSMGDYSFRLGDEDDDLGHRGFPGIAGSRGNLVWCGANHRGIRPPRVFGLPPPADGGPGLSAERAAVRKGQRRERRPK